MPSVSARPTAHATPASFSRDTPQKARRLSPSLIDHVAIDAFGPENPLQFDLVDSDGELGEWLDGKTLIEAAAELGELRWTLSFALAEVPTKYVAHVEP